MEGFFYYREKRIVAIRSHISPDLMKILVAEEKNVPEPRIMAEENADEYIYYVDLIGVRNKEDISTFLEGSTMKIKAKIKGLGKPEKEEFEEYKIALELPEGVKPEDIKAKFYPDKGLLVIRVRKKKPSLRKLDVE